MPEGFDWSEPPFAKKVFYPPFGKVFLALLPLYFVCGLLPMMYISRSEPIPWGTADWTFLLLVVVAASALAAWLLYVLARVDLTPRTISSMNDLSLRQTVSLEGITSVTRPWYALRLFVIVKHKDALTRLWVPTFLKERDEFVSALSQVVQSENLLLTFLRTMKQHDRKS